MVDKRDWNEFRDSGMLWFVNTILHAFGWAICLDINDGGKVSEVFPARVKFRGFEGDINDMGYRNVARYLLENSESIYDDAMKG